VNLVSKRATGISKTKACAALGVARGILYEDQRGARAPRPMRARKKPPRALAPEEKVQALALLHSERFIDHSPRQMVATLLSEGSAIASVSTLYRLLRGVGETTPRVQQRAAQQHAVPRLIARAPHQVWTWDITKLPTFVRGVFLCLYVILDLYSRAVVGWMVAKKENAGLAKHLFKHTIAKYQIEPHTLIVHQDRGAPMIAHTFRELLADADIAQSYSRPRVSNDNPHSESHFKTIKYCATYPGRFVDALRAREWLTNFFANYLDRPHHGIEGYTPNDLLFGRSKKMTLIRQTALDEHFSRFPERYVHGRPIAKAPPAQTMINPLDGVFENARALLETPAAFTKQYPPTTMLPDSFVS
jgi:putative transposase